MLQFASRQRASPIGRSSDAHAETIGDDERVDRVSEPTGSVSGTTNQSLP